MRFQAPRGTHDVLPAESHRWRALERKFERLVSLYGYREMRTPTMESTDLFVRTSGDTSDIVTKQMFTFEDRGGRSVTLKPEGTAPVVRACLESGLLASGGVTRLWYCTPIFRHERPQRGRYRESHQVGLELLGSASPEADSEVIEVTVRFFESLGLTGLNVLINSIGDAETRAAYRDVLLAHFEPTIRHFPDDVRERYRKNPLRMVDSKDPDLAQAIACAPKVTDYLSPAAQEHFDEVQSLLSAAGVEYQVAPEIVRGLDYYTSTVFEVQSGALGAQNSLCGGGRYDGLVADIGGPPTPAVGVAMGIERALLVQEELGIAESEPRVAAFLLAATDSARNVIRDLARKLRDADLPALYDFEGKNLRAQFKAADRAGARYGLILGDDELARGEVTARDLDSGEQQAVPLDEAVRWVSERA